MTNRTYAGHTLAEIKAAAQAAPVGPWDFDVAIPERGICAQVWDADGNDLFTAGATDRCSHAVAFSATANPATVLAMAARIEELERELGEWEKLKSPEFLHINLLRGIPARLTADQLLHIAGGHYQSMETRIVELKRERDAARLQGWQAAREQAAKICDQMGDKMDAEVNGQNHEHIYSSVCAECSDNIMDMHPPAEWQYAEALNTPTIDDVMKMAHRYLVQGITPEWPHPDGFAGGLTERNHDGQD